MPWYLQVAIEHALIVLNWHENLSSEDIPPEHLWEDAEGLEMWWKTVEDRRKDGDDSPRSSRDRVSVVPDGEDGGEEPEDGMAQNQLAAALKRG